MGAVKVMFLFALVAGIMAAKDPNGHCQLKRKGGSKKVCNGAIGKDMGKFVKICLKGILKIKKKASVEPAAKQCENAEGEVFCEGDVVEEKTCNQQEKYMKKCENGTLGWKKEALEGSPLKESCDPCPSCQLEGKLYCDTEVVQEKSCGGEEGYKRVCESGKLSSWQTDSPSGSLAAPCEWYGMAFCDQEVIEDLYRWWFLQKCSKGKMNLLGRPWSEVVSDPRYKALQDNTRGGV